MAPAANGALARQAGGHWFEPSTAHQLNQAGWAKRRGPFRGLTSCVVRLWSDFKGAADHLALIAGESRYSESHRFSWSDPHDVAAVPASRTGAVEAHERRARHSCATINGAI